MDTDTMLAGLAGRRQFHQAQQMQAAQQALAADCARSDGWDGLLRRLERAGLGEAVRSWGEDGPRRPVSPAHLRAALGGAKVQRIAARAGMTDDELTAELSRCLPEIVAQLARRERPPPGAARSRGAAPRPGRADRQP